MKLKYFFVAIFFTAAIACNNEASSDSNHTADSTKSGWPGASEILGNDSMHSPETQTDSSRPTLK